MARTRKYRTNTVPARAHQLMPGDMVLWGGRLVTITYAQATTADHVRIVADDGSVADMQRDAKVQRVAAPKLPAGLSAVAGAA